ncbi:hypothetical protein K7432_003507 [Basidiobolus ranarum]|uniref:DUF8032 domain-containing protein n=1 Tax=Basidiobolus ranarum TaxID=34480 RepID=A0ABR2WZN6_9FUNG
MDGFFQQKPQLIQPRPTFYNITLAQLLDPTFSCDQVLDELTADQLLSIERTVGKARKNRESLGRCNGGRIGKPKEKHEPKLRPPLENFSTKKPINTTNQYEPSTFTKDEVEWLCFWYAHKKRMQRHEIRIDVESVNTEDLEHQFKVDNCVYPRAFCSKEEYHGNRWHYETECNDLGWRLSFLNQELLSGKRGLIQRAVDSFRNRHPSLRSRRVARQEKLNNGTLRKRKPRSSISSGESTASSDSPLNTPDSDTLIYRDVHSGALWPVYININEVDVADIDDDFKQRNSVFMRGLMKADYPHLGQQMSCNEIAWKLV